VLNPAELSGLPFEIARGIDNAYLFEASPPVIITRRIRGAHAMHRRPWPGQPKILFAWASPDGAGTTVPSDENLEGLLAALTPWIEPLPGVIGVPDYRSVLTILEKASLATLTATCAAEHWTHIHVLAHGCEVGGEDDPIEERFGLALHGKDGGVDAVGPDAIAQALAGAAESCVAVTLASCFGGSQRNTLIPEGGLAHSIHERGIPIVIGSQWPLTFEGSRVMANTFYTALLRGDDARHALHRTRTAMRACAGCNHDWASLVGYVSLPEGYADHLLTVRLKQLLAALNTSSKWADALVLKDSRDEAVFRRVDAQIASRIDELRSTMQESEAAGRSQVVQENLGLIGSAFKRRAELLHHWNRLVGTDADRAAAMLESLREARAWYAKGFERQLSDHWLGTQNVSLALVLDGRLADGVTWAIARHAADVAARAPNEYWALGSQAELQLLGALAGQTQDLDAAEAALRLLRDRAPDDFPTESTRRQLARYRDWWTSANGFFGGGTDLSNSVGRLLDALA
jgi:hypothetical protein